MLLKGRKFEVNMSGGNGLVVVDMKFYRANEDRPRRIRAVALDDRIRIDHALCDEEEAALCVFVQDLLMSLDGAAEDYVGRLQAICDAQLEVFRGAGLN